jgi:hypothetical protein
MKSFKHYLIESIIDDGDGMGGPNDMRGRNRVPPGSIPPPKGPPPTPMYLVPTVTQDGEGYPTIPGNFPKPPNTFGQPQIDYDDLDRLLRELEQYLLDYDDRHYYGDLLKEKLRIFLLARPGLNMGQLRNMEMKNLIAQARLDILKKYPHMTDQQRQTIEKLLKALYYRWAKELRDRHPELIPHNFSFP